MGRCNSVGMNALIVTTWGKHGTRVEAGSLRRISGNDDRKVRDCVFKEENNIESWQNTRNIRKR